MMYNLISELNNKLNFTLTMATGQIAWTGDELITLVSRNVIGLTGEDIAFILAVCRRHNVKLIRWGLAVEVEKEPNSGLTGSTYRSINILTLSIRAMHEWESA